MRTTLRSPRSVLHTCSLNYPVREGKIRIHDIDQKFLFVVSHVYCANYRSDHVTLMIMSHKHYFKISSVRSWEKTMGETMFLRCTEGSEGSS